MPTVTYPTSVVSASKLQIAVARAGAMHLLESRCHTQPSDDFATPEIPESTGKIAKAEIKHLSGVVAQLMELRQQGACDDYGASQLDEQVFNQARELLINAAIELVFCHRGAKMPHGCASTDDEGGLRLEWFRDEASVHLVIPAPSSSLKRYIFHKIGTSQAIEATVSPEVLARWLSQIGD